MAINITKVGIMEEALASADNTKVSAIDKATTIAIRLQMSSDNLLA